MAFRVGSIVADAKLDTKQWTSGASKLMSSVGKVSAVIAGTLIAVMTKSVMAANEWQKSLSNVNTLLDSTTTNSQDMAMSLLRLDARLGSTTELTDAMYQAFSAGAEDMDEALAVTTASAKFARAALTDTATAVDVLTTATNAYGKENMSAERASDIFFTTIKQGKINGEQLSSVIGKSIPLFASLNVPLEQLGAGMAAMTKQGVNASEATTQLNAIMNSFIKPSTAMTAALEAQGYASGSALIESEGLDGALKFLETTTGGNIDAMGELLPSIEAVRGVMALTGTGGEEFTNILNEMENSAGSTEEAFAKQELTFETFRNQMDKTMLIVGNVGKAFVDDLAVGATKAGVGMTEFLTSSEGAMKVANVIAILAGGFQLIKGIIQPIAEVVLPELKEIFDTTKESIENLAGEGQESITLFDILSGAVQFTTSGFKVFSTIIQANIRNISNLVVAIKEGGGTVGKFFEFITGKATWEEVSDQATGTVEALGVLVDGFVEGTVDVFSTIGTEVKSFSSNVAENSANMENAVTTAMDNTRANVNENWAELITGQEGTNELLENLAAENQQTLNGILQDGTNEGTRILTEAEEERLSLFSNYLDKGVSLEEMSYQERKDNLQSLYDDQLISQEEFNEISKQLEKERVEDLTNTIVGYVDTAIGALSGLLGFIEDAGAESRDRELSEVEANYNAQLEALATTNRDGNINDIEYAKKKDELNKQKLAKENEIKKKEFETNKAWTITNIWLDALAGGMNAWANNDWVTALVITGLITAEAIAATASASSQTFVPAKRTGGMASGLTRINEQGGEIVNLPDGSQVIPNDISRRIAGNSGSSGVVINNNFNGASIRSEADIEAIANKVSSKIARDLRTA